MLIALATEKQVLVQVSAFLSDAMFRRPAAVLTLHVIGADSGDLLPVVAALVWVPESQRGSLFAWQRAQAAAALVS